MDDFVHLHVHSMGSLLDGLPTPAEIIERVKELDQPAVALTDHGSMAAMLQFGKAAKANGVKPLFGVEGYLTDDLDVKDKESATYHIGLIAKTDEGLKNLYKLTDIAWNRGFYKKPRIDLDTLNAYREGVIALSGCMNGCISDNLLNGKVEEAVQWHKDLTQAVDDVYIEIQPWNPPGLNEDLIELNKDAAPVVVTADTHYCKQEDKFAEEVALLIQTVTQMKLTDRQRVYGNFAESRKISNEFDRLDYLHPDRSMSFKDIDNYIMSRRNLENKFPEGTGYVDGSYYSNTVALANSVMVEVPESADFFPTFSSSVQSDDYLREISFEGLEQLKLAGKPEYVERLEEELEIIKRLKFSDYMLVVWDIVAWAKAQGIMVGPGRGSVGGSLLAYTLGITEVDPLKYGLLFWRFLNISVAYEPRFEVIEKMQ